MHTVYLLVWSLPVSGHSSWHFLKQCWRDQACQKLSPAKVCKHILLRCSVVVVLFGFFSLLLEVERKAASGYVDINWATEATKPQGHRLFSGMFYLVEHMPAQRLYFSLWFTDTLQGRRQEEDVTKLQAKILRNKGQTVCEELPPRISLKILSRYFLQIGVTLRATEFSNTSNSKGIYIRNSNFPYYLCCIAALQL